MGRLKHHPDDLIRLTRGVLVEEFVAMADEVALELAQFAEAEAKPADAQTLNLSTSGWSRNYSQAQVKAQKRRRMPASDSGDDAQGIGRQRDQVRRIRYFRPLKR